MSASCPSLETPGPLHSGCHALWVVEPDCRTASLLLKSLPPELLRSLPPELMPAMVVYSCSRCLAIMLLVWHWRGWSSSRPVWSPGCFILKSIINWCLIYLTLRLQGPEIKSGSISKEMLRHVYTRGSRGFRDWFPMLSIKRKNQRSFSFKAHCVWKKLP